MLEVILGLIGVCIAFWVLWRRKKLLELKEMGIPGPEPNFFFGNIWEFKKNPLECQKEWVKKYGRVFGYYFGMQPIVVVADLELLKKIQVSEFHKFINRAPIFSPGRKSPSIFENVTKHLTGLRDRRWKEIRSIVTPSFTTSKMRLMTPVLNSSADLLIENIDGKIKEGKSFDIYQLYKLLTLDVIGRTAFGIQTDVQKNPDNPLLKSAKKIFSESLSSFTTIFALSFPEFDRIFLLFRTLRRMFPDKDVNPIKDTREALSEVIKIRRQNKSKGKTDLLQLMIDAHMSEKDLKNVTGQHLTAGDEADENEQMKTKEDSSNRTEKLLRYMTDEEIQDNAILLFLAGYETTSTALAFVTHFLINYPEVQERIRNEIKDLIGTQDMIDYSSVQNLQYLDQVVNESLRLYPPIYSFVNRQAGEDVDLGNFRIRKGTALQVPNQFLQSDPESWSEPEKFLPERFAPENKSQIRPLSFQAFGAGPRNCIAMRFAQLEIKIVISRILQKYRLMACDGTEKGSLTLEFSQMINKPSKGIIIKAERC